MWIQYDSLQLNNDRYFALVTSRSSSLVRQYDTSSHIWAGGFQIGIDCTDGCLDDQMIIDFDFASAAGRLAWLRYLGDWYGHG